MHIHINDSPLPEKGSHAVTSGRSVCLLGPPVIQPTCEFAWSNGGSQTKQQENATHTHMHNHAHTHPHTTSVGLHLHRIHEHFNYDEYQTLARTVAGLNSYSTTAVMPYMGPWAAWPFFAS